MTNWPHETPPGRCIYWPRTCKQVQAQTPTCFNPCAHCCPELYQQSSTTGNSLSREPGDREKRAIEVLAKARYEECPHLGPWDQIGDEWQGTFREKGREDLGDIQAILGPPDAEGVSPVRFRPEAVQHMREILRGEADGFDPRCILCAEISRALAIDPAQAITLTQPKDGERLEELVAVAMDAATGGVKEGEEVGDEIDMEAAVKAVLACLSPENSSGVEEGAPPNPKLVLSSLRWAVAWIDEHGKFTPEMPPGDASDWLEWAGAHDLLKDAHAASTQPVSPQPDSTTRLSDSPRRKSPLTEMIERGEKLDDPDSRFRKPQDEEER